MKKIAMIILLSPAAAFGQFCSNCITNSAAPQAAQMNITSATIRGQLTVGSLSLSTFSVVTGTATNFYGGGAGLTNLNATQLLLGTVPSGRMTGAYSGITGVGTITAGLWQGTPVGTQYGGTGQNFVNISTGSIPYFDNVGHMATLYPGTPQGLLQTNGATLAPVWTSSPSVSGLHIYGIPLTALSSGTLPTNILVTSNSITAVQGSTVLGNINGIALGGSGNFNGGTVLNTTTFLSSVTVRGAQGLLVTSSVTASAFFGDGTHLTGLNTTFNGGTVSNYTRFLSSANFNGGGGLGVTYGVTASSLTLGADLYMQGNQIDMQAGSAQTNFAFNFNGKANVPIILYNGSGSIEDVISPNASSYFNGGSLGILTATPGATLDVNGNAQFGSGAIKSTFTSTGNLAVPFGITAATMTATSSSTASAFYGDGSHLTNVTATNWNGGAVPNTSTFASSVTINGLGGLGAKYGITAATMTATSSMTASAFYGDGSHLRGIPSTGSIVGVYLPLAGGTMTGNLTVNNSTIQVKGPLLATGVLGGVVVSGAGTRFEWIPSSAAIRAGGTFGTEWDAANIGPYSAAFGYANQAKGPYSTVSGGIFNYAGSGDATVSGGNSNIADGPDGFVGGGYNNKLYSNSTFIGGGDSNFVNQSYSAITAGHSNSITGQYSFIGAGNTNVVNSTYSVVVGGLNNSANGQFAFTGGGNNNQATGLASVVVGGQVNTSSGSYATVSGGTQNQASGGYATVGGGISNTASGGGANIPGGEQNQASGDKSFAAGFQARSAALGSFTWADSQGGPLQNNTTDNFLVQAHGGVTISNPGWAQLQTTDGGGFGTTQGQLEFDNMNAGVAQASATIQGFRDEAGDSIGLEFMTKVTGANIGPSMWLNSYGQLSVSPVNGPGPYYTPGSVGLRLDNGKNLWVNNGDVIAGAGLANPGRFVWASGGDPSIINNYVARDNADILHQETPLQEYSIYSLDAMPGDPTLDKRESTLSLCRSDGLLCSGINAEGVDITSFRDFDSIPKVLFNINRAGAGQFRDMYFNLHHAPDLDDHIMKLVATSTSVVIYHELLVGSSVTASAFFGDGSHLTGVSGSISGGIAGYATVWTGATNISNATLGHTALFGDNVTVNQATMTVNGPIISTGTNGGVSYSGTGTRFEWIPSSGAFRAGGALNTDWDAALIGAYSVGLGYGSISQGDYSVVSGGNQNTAAAANTGVGGGFSNNITVAATSSYIGGGNKNTISGAQSFIGGGFKNTDSAACSSCTISGGSNNSAQALNATIGGGDLNVVSDQFSTIGGGQSNLATGTPTFGYSTIAGGSGNNATGDYSSIGGGKLNLANGAGSHIGGGGYDGGTGSFNTASGTASTIGGGTSNIASGALSVVPGGKGNHATKTYAFAAGFSALANAPGAFAWADSQGTSLPNNTTDQFQVTAEGGVVLYTSSITVLASNGSTPFYVDASTMSVLGTALVVKATIAGTPLVGIGVGLATTALSVYGVITSSTTQGTVSCSAGTAVQSATCTDQHCTFAAGAASTSCTYVFGHSWPKVPDCVAITNGVTPIALSIPTVTVNSILISAGLTALTGDNITFICTGAP